MPKKTTRRAAKPAPRLPEDFEELLGAFEREGVEYLIVGGYAVGAHGRPRATKDIDLWIGGGENLDRVARALLAFGMPSTLGDAVRASAPDEVIWFGAPPRRVDLLRSIDGVSFDSARSRGVRTRLGDLEVSIIGLDDLITNKKTAGRDTDLVDARHLEEIRASRESPR